MTGSLMNIDMATVDRVSYLVSRMKEAAGPLDTPCWEWQRCRNNYGYGHTSYGKAHRLSYEVFVGSIPKRLCVCHHCDNPACINPRHLFLGTDADNAADKNAKGRQVQGEAHPSSKFTEEQVTRIYGLIDDGVPLYEIAKCYAVGEFTISNISTGKSWKHLFKRLNRTKRYSHGGSRHSIQPRGLSIIRKGVVS